MTMEGGRVAMTILLIVVVASNDVLSDRGRTFSTPTLPDAALRPSLQSMIPPRRSKRRSLDLPSIHELNNRTLHQIADPEVQMPPPRPNNLQESVDNANRMLSSVDRRLSNVESILAQIMTRLEEPNVRGSDVVPVRTQPPTNAFLSSDSSDYQGTLTVRRLDSDDNLEINDCRTCQSLPSFLILSVYQRFQFHGSEHSGNPFKH